MDSNSQGLSATQKTREIFTCIERYRPLRGQNFPGIVDKCYSCDATIARLSFDFFLDVPL